MWRYQYPKAAQFLAGDDLLDVGNLADCQGAPPAGRVAARLAVGGDAS